MTLPLLRSALSATGSFLGGIQTYLIVGAVSAALAGAGGFYSGYRWEAAALATRVAQDAVAEAKAVQAQADRDRREGRVSLVAAVAEARAQAAFEHVAFVIQLEIANYVTPAQDTRVAAACGISVGFYRVLRAAEGGVTPDALQLAAGQSDDDCADIPASALAGGLAQAIGTGNANAEQLNAVIQWIKDNHKAQEAP